MWCGAVLYFDPETEARLRALAVRLMDAGVAAPLAYDIRPHLSLAAAEGDDAGRSQELLAALARTTPPLTIQLAAVGAFPTDEGVVYIAPVATEALLALHARFHAEVAALGCPMLANYRPGRWVPHVTVAIGLPPDKVGPAVAACCRSDVFGPATLVEAALYQTPPPRQICTYLLQG